MIIDLAGHQGVPLEEVIQFGAVEDAGGGSDGADGGGAQSACDLEAAVFVAAPEVSGDVAGIEGIATAGAIDEGDGVSAEADVPVCGGRERALRAHGDDDALRPHVSEGAGLLVGIAEAEDELRFIVVGEEDIGVGEDDFEVGEVISRSWAGDIDDGEGAGGAEGLEAFGEGADIEAGEDEEVTDVEDGGRGLMGECGIEIVDGECAVGAHGMDEAAVFVLHVDDEGLAGGVAGVDLNAAGIDAAELEGFPSELTEDVVADFAADFDGDLQPGEVDRGVCRAAADGEDEFVGEDQFSRARDVVDGAAKVVGDDEPRAEDTAFGIGLQGHAIRPFDGAGSGETVRLAGWVGGIVREIEGATGIEFGGRGGDLEGDFPGLRELGEGGAQVTDHRS